jgi:integrase
LDVQVRNVTPAQLEVWLAKHKARMKRASINAYIIFIRQLFKLAVSSRAVAESPAAEFKMLKPEDPIRNTPSWPQFQKIVESIRSQKLNDDAQNSADVVEFMGLAGVGTAECAHLKGEHIDFETNRIWLYRHKTDHGYSIPIFPQRVPVLDMLKKRNQIRHGQTIFRVRDPKKALAAACKRLGYPNYSTRSLRRCFITRAVEKGIDFKTIASWQGHQDGGALIAKTYSHLRAEHSDAMARKLA